MSTNLSMKAPKILAFLLPQFHRIPENDQWWGDGFTEWTNVKKARPLFTAHAQPRVPLANNYYDLTDAATQEWQAELARQHGLHGFCYYHYWFNGKQLLEQPFNLVLNRGKPDFPFCLAWANEPWTRTWDGGDSHVLMRQTYGGPVQWEQHFSYLLRAFQDPRYIRVEGKPVFLIYRTESISVCPEMLACWRELATQNGLPGLHVVSMLTYFEGDNRKSLFDGFAEFEPMFSMMRLPFLANKVEQLFNKWTRLLWQHVGTAPNAPQSRDYATLWRAISRRKLPQGHYPGAFVDWDNTPRKGFNKSWVMRNVSLSVFASGFAAQYRKACKANAEFLFVNAWNEWAEGTYLEPDEARGAAFLEVIARVSDSINRQ